MKLNGKIFKKTFLGCLFFFLLFSSSISHAGLTIYCSNKDMILIEAKNAKIDELFLEINQKFNVETLNIDGIENRPLTIYLFDSPLDKVVEEIIHLAKLNNYAIFYRAQFDNFYFLTKILFFTHEDDKDEMNIINFSKKETKKFDELDSLNFWLDPLTDENLKNRKEALQNIAKFLDPERKNIFLNSLKSFFREINEANEEGENVDREMVKRIARDMLQEFFGGIPKPTYGR